MKLVPDFQPALEEMRRIKRSFDAVDIAHGFDEFAKTGLPLLVCEVDHPATEATGDLVFVYKLADELLISFPTIGAR